MIKPHMRRAKLISELLAAKCGHFNEEGIRLAHAEACSVIDYIVEIHGDDRWARLLAAYDDGLVTDRTMDRLIG